ncbi:hypothetical protein JW979_05155 [bacterium]|nr:hypothetical protein [candidate division CSSED10-310 bacterium]
MKFIHDILSTIAIDKVAEKLGLSKFEDFGIGLFCDCPTGHPSVGTPGFGFEPGKHYFFCFNCGIEGDTIELVQLIKKMDTYSAIEWIIDSFCPERRQEFSAFDRNAFTLSPKPKDYYVKGFLHEAIYRFGKKQLMESEEGRKSYSRLRELRGYHRTTVENTEWIYFPPENEIRSHLTQEYPRSRSLVSGTPKKSFEDKLPLQGEYGDKFRLAFPYRDVLGLITGFVKRASIRETKGKWDFTSGIIREDVFNLCKCKGFDSIILLESYPDAMSIPASGFQDYGTAAVGQVTFSDQQIYGLKDLGIENVIIAMANEKDRDEKARREVIISQISEILRRHHINVFVFKSSGLGDYRDFEEYLFGNRFSQLLPNDVSSLKNIIQDNTQNQTQWIAQMSIDKYERSDATDQKRILSDLLNQRSTINQVKDLKEFDQVVMSGLKLSDEAYQEILKQHSVDSKSAYVKSAIQEIFKEGLKPDLDINELVLINKRADELISKYVLAYKSSGVELKNRMNDKYSKDSNRAKGQTIGYTSKVFKTLTKMCNGFQPGLFVISGNEETGKTSIIINLFHDLLLSNQDVSGLFVSLDESVNAVVDRIIGCNTGLNISDIRYQMEGPNQNKKERSYSEFIDMAGSGKLSIRDYSEINSFDQLLSLLQATISKGSIIAIDRLDMLLPTLYSGQSDSVGLCENILKLKSLATLYESPFFVTVKQFESLGYDERVEDSGKVKTNPVLEIADVYFSIIPKSQEASSIDAIVNPCIQLKCRKNKHTYKHGRIEVRLETGNGLRVSEISDSYH